MRAVKAIIGVAGLVALGMVVYSYYSAPARWVAEARRNSIQALAKAQSIPELEEAVKPYGVLVHTADDSWVAICYHDTHYISPIQSLAIAKDSGGWWYSCDRHFCGWLTSFARERARQQNPALLKDMFPETGGPKGEPGYERMEALFGATNLASLRAALKQLDFQEFTPK